MKSKDNFIKKFPYKTFVPTYVGKSNIRGAGYGLFSKKYLKPFTWIGFYPGNLTTKISTNENEMYIMGTSNEMYIMGTSNENEMYIMGTSNNKYYIEADSSIKCGVHMVNEASANTTANVWYIKLSNNYCLYFTGKSIKPNEELLTCYSKTYGNRLYPISNNCSDPRCIDKYHRKNSMMLNEWRDILNENIPKYLDKIVL